MSNYKGIAHDCTVTVDLSEEESAAVLKAYDYGLHNLDKEQQRALNAVISKLKDQIWP